MLENNEHKSSLVTGDKVKYIRISQPNRIPAKVYHDLE